MYIAIPRVTIENIKQRDILINIDNSEWNIEECPNNPLEDR